MRRRVFFTFIGGSIAAWPLAGRAQQRMAVAGIISVASPGGLATRLEALRQGLREQGYREGQNLSIEYRFAEDHPERLRDLAIDLVQRHVDVLSLLAGLTLR